MKKSICLILLSIVIISCNTLPQKNKLYQSYSSLSLGALGMNKKNVRKTDYQVVGSPVLSQKIKLRATFKNFNKSNFKSYKDFISSTLQKELIQFNDSLEQIPSYLEIEIEDKIELIKQLNSNNENIINYLTKNPQTTIVTKLKIVGEANLYDKIIKADAFYLQTGIDKKQFFIAYNNREQIIKINLSSLQTYEYDISSFCWELLSNGKPRISSIVEEGTKCRNKTYRNPQKALEEKINKIDF